ncbi:hypothetical protein GCK32_000800 [Trichostrongylus colubriformis]|uniref:Uncharacterized protein n=1 Tax=Trichostrongylus colubriformis TaxID=6319 RepID=A0AAN8EW24_TRICO
MDLRTNNTGLHGILDSLMEAIGQIRATTTTIRNVIGDNFETMSPARAECKMRMAFDSVRIELRKLGCDMRRLEDYMVTSAGDRF